MLFALTCCRDASKIERDIKTTSISKEFEINGEKDTSIYKVGELINNKSGLIVPDMLDYKIKLFDNNGAYRSSFGGKGNSPGNFEKSPCKLAYDSLSRRLAVYEYTSSHIQNFNDKLKQISEIMLRGPISGLQFDNKSNLITAYLFVHAGIQYFNIWDLSGNNILSFNPSHLDDSGLLNIFKFSFNKQLNKIIVMYLYRNLIQVYDKNGNLEKEFSLSFLPKLSETRMENIKTPVGTMQNKFPLHYMFHDVSTDNTGKIYLLAGYYSPNGGERKIIYVVNIDGTVLNKIVLDTRANSIFCGDNNCLFTVSEKQNIITKYRINEK